MALDGKMDLEKENQPRERRSNTVDEDYVAAGDESDDAKQDEKSDGYHEEQEETESGKVPTFFCSYPSRLFFTEQSGSDDLVFWTNRFIKFLLYCIF